MKTQNRTRRTFVLIAAMAAGALALTGCVANDPPESEEGGGSLVMLRAEDTGGWDPLFASSNATLWMNDLVYGTLVRSTTDATDFTGDIAESWEVDPSGKKITFELREGITFSDGTPLTVDDVTFAFDRLLHDPESGLASVYPEGTTVDAEGESTIVIATPDVTPSLLSQLSTVRIYSKAHFEEVGKEQFALEPLGSGPFVLDEWRAGEAVNLVRNENYWDQPKPYLDSVEIRVVADANARALQIQSGDADIALDIPLNQLVTMGKDPAFKTITSEIKGRGILLLNHANPEQPAFRDLKVREAINYAIDKQAIIDGVFFGYASPMSSVLTGGVLEDPDREPWPYDVEKAKSLMAESGYPNGFTTEFVVSAGDQVSEGTATIIQANLAEIGISVELLPLEPGAARSAVVNDDGSGTFTYEMGLVQYTNDAVDDGGIFRFCCVASVGNRNSARTHYENPDVDALYLAAESEGDPAVRKEMYKDLQEMVWQDAPFGFLYNLQARAVTSSEVEGFEITATGYHPLTEVRVSR